MESDVATSEFDLADNASDVADDASDSTSTLSGLDESSKAHIPSTLQHFDDAWSEARSWVKQSDEALQKVSTVDNTETMKRFAEFIENITTVVLKEVKAATQECLEYAESVVPPEVAMPALKVADITSYAEQQDNIADQSGERYLRDIHPGFVKQENNSFWDTDIFSQPSQPEEETETDENSQESSCFKTGFSSNEQRVILSASAQKSSGKSSEDAHETISKKAVKVNKKRTALKNKSVELNDKSTDGQSNRKKPKKQTVTEKKSVKNTGKNIPSPSKAKTPKEKTVTVYKSEERNGKKAKDPSKQKAVKKKPKDKEDKTAKTPNKRNRVKVNALTRKWRVAEQPMFELPTEELLIYKCDVCHERFAHKKPLDLHVANEHVFVIDEEESCMICYNHYPTKPEFVKHMRTEHPEVPENKCGICGQIRKNIIGHYNGVHYKKFKCEDCGKTFKGSTTLDVHRRIHTNERPFKCHVCDFGARGRDGLVLHMQSHFPQPVTCKVCQREFKNKTSLRAHTRYKHTKYRPNVCSICGKGFVQRSKLKAHMFVHTGVSDFQCSVCKRYFALPDRLRKHMHIHTKIPVNPIPFDPQPIQCPWCMGLFANHRDFVAHLPVEHPEAPPDLCVVCGRHVKGPLLAHVRTAHWKCYKCHICGKYYSRRLDLSFHVQSHAKDQEQLPSSAN